jgi:hypothetical protein
MERGNRILVVIVVIMMLALLGPGRLSGADSGQSRCSEAEMLNKENVCEPIIVVTERGSNCPTGYSMEASDEERPGAVQVSSVYYLRCIPRRPGMPGYVISETKKDHPTTPEQIRRLQEFFKQR